MSHALFKGPWDLASSPINTAAICVYTVYILLTKSPYHPKPSQPYDYLEFPGVRPSSKGRPKPGRRRWPGSFLGPQDSKGRV